MTESETKRVLGRGLQALLDDIEDELPSAAPTGSGIQTLPIAVVSPNPGQPRKEFDDEELDELADSIRAKGLIQPILVRPLPEDDSRYEIVAGERRWRAAQRALLHDIPVIIRELNDADAFEIAIIENIQRSDLNAMEEAIGYKQLKEKYGYTQDELAKNLGKSRSHIANTIRLANLPNKVQEMVRGGELSAGHARALLSCEDPEQMALKVIEQSLSVRQLEEAVKTEEPPSKDVASSQNMPTSKREKDADTLSLEAELGAALMMRVEISHKGRRGGELKITYRTLDDLEDVCARLRQDVSNILASA